MIRRAAYLLIPVAIVGVVVAWLRSPRPEGPTFRTASVSNRNILVTIASSGTVEPEVLVDVGAQVAGIVKEFGKAADGGREIDYGSAVEPGTVLARIDDSSYVEEVHLARAALTQSRAKRQQAEAAVKQAKANVKRAEADLMQTEVTLRHAGRELQRGQALVASRSIAAQDLDTYQKAADLALAAVDVSKAALAQSQASLEIAQEAMNESHGQVEGSEATLRKAETNLGYTTIRSPIAGVVIDRRVNIGQTVVANLSAPSLFLIAQDLKRMQVWVSVNEADIGKVRVGQKVRFTVDAYGDEEFDGDVGQVRLNASMVQNVVTYTVVVNVDNSGGRLLPYMTTNVRFQVASRSNVLAVPAAALRWQPKPEQIVESHRERFRAEGRPRQKKDENSGRGDTGASSRRMVWVADGAFVRPVEIQTGITDGVWVEVLSGELSDGQEVVTGVNAPKQENLVNPFAPSLAKDIGQSK